MNRKYYPLTHPQKAMWNIDKLYPGTSIGNIAATLRIKGDIDYNVLERAINLAVQNNDGTRLRFVEEDGQPKQYLADWTYKKIRFHDFSGKGIEELYKWDEEQAKNPFKITDSELIQFDLIKVDENDGGLFARAHHLIADAWTMSILGNQIMEYYAVLKRGEEIPCKKNASYLDYLQNETDYLNSDRLQKDKLYWDREFELFPQKTVLKDYNLAGLSPKARRKTIVTPKKLTDKIYRYCAENKTSPFVLFVAALAMYINRVTSNEDIILGTTTLNRSNLSGSKIREKEIVGMFSNILPIRVTIYDHMDFHTFAKAVSAKAIALLKHQRYPFDLILKEVRKKHRITGSLFDFVVTYQNAKFAKEKNPEQYITRWHFNGYQTELLNISINDRENEGQLIIDYSYLTDVFNAKEIEFINQHIINILWHALDNPAKKISKLNMLSEVEYHKVVYKFNDIGSENTKERIIYNKSGEAIGKIPVQTGCYILDRNLNPMPISIPGELYFSRELNLSEVLNLSVKQNPPDKQNFHYGLSKENLLDNPFLPEGKIYRSGYWARWYPNGDIVLFDQEEAIPGRPENRQQETQVQVVIAATFTAEPVGKYIQWWAAKFGHQLRIEFAGYNQVLQQLLDQESLVSQNKTGFNLLLVRFEDFIRNVSGSSDTKIFKLEQAFEELSQAIIQQQRTSPLLIPILPPAAEANLPQEIRGKIAELNAKMRQKLSACDNVYILDLQEIQELYDIEEVFDSFKDKEAHMPFTEEYYAAIGTQIARKICALQRQHFKVIVLDCDNTLWKGICGESDPAGVAVTENYRELQRFMLQKQREGMLLAICSKNNESDVLHVFDRNPDMVLGKNHITCWKVNWQEKSKNIKEIAQELNLSPDSFIFVDDSPLECSKMVESCPEVLTLQLPEEEYIPIFLRHCWAFDKENVTKEDSLRSALYQAESRRNAIKEKGLTLEEFIKNLQLQVSMRLVEDTEIERAAQLTQRTNQFNLSTIRRTKQEIKLLSEEENTEVFVIEATDKFGDYGIVGLVILKQQEENALLDSFLLSCRILGRKVEDVILTGMKKYAREKGVKSIIARFLPTPKNKVILEFLERTNRHCAARQEDGSTIYTFAVGALPEKIEDISFCYKEKYPVLAPEALAAMDELASAVDTARDHSKPPALDPGSRPEHADSSWKSEGAKPVELLRTDLLENLANPLHQAYLLPLKYFSGKKLLELPLYQPASGLGKQTEYRAPRNAIEEKLVALWEEILDFKPIGINSDFFEIGGDSLLAVSFLAKMNKELHSELTLRDVLELRTVSLLAERISHGENTQGIKNVPTLISKRSSKNLFLIHAGNGELIPYLALAKVFKGDYSLWGIRFVKLNHFMPFMTTIEELAADYVSQIKTVQAAGPYYLAGWCFGGVIAYEMARQLEARGETIQFLGLINSAASVQDNGIREFTLANEKQLLSHILDLDDPDIAAIHNMEDLWPAFVEKYKNNQAISERIKEEVPNSVKHAIPNYSQTDLSTLIYYLNVLRTLNHARVQYNQPHKVRKACYFAAMDDDIMILNQQENIAQWNQLLETQMTVYPVKGDHYSIFDQDLPSLAERLQESLAAVDKAN